MEGSSVDTQPTARDHLFGQVYNRKKKAVVEDVAMVEDVDITNPNSMTSPDDPSPMNEELPIALRKGTRSCTSHPIQRFVSYAKLNLKVEVPHVAEEDVLLFTLRSEGYRVWIWTRTHGHGYRGGSCFRRRPCVADSSIVSDPCAVVSSVVPSSCAAVFCAFCVSAVVGVSRSRLSPPPLVLPSALVFVWRWRFSRRLLRPCAVTLCRRAPKSENLPVQVTSIRLTKDNYLSWSAALEIGITSRGRLPYITGDKPAPSKTDPQWATWALEDSQVKVWIISSVSADIQPLILRKPTSFDMWTVLARMYGRKKRVLRTYQIKRSIYSLKQGDLSVASFYAALKTKWEKLDYHVNDD
ncbi:hypothetical protein EJ110_NYTH55507 [Nymphaea thermarum]|nr:hypothetical protein EJ110_NYTH55507 [Nymphaea thermarum]